jgi:formiminoglutamase
MDRQQRGMDFSYLCLGIQPLANTRSLFATARGLHTHYLFAEQIQQQTMQQTVEEVQAFIDRHKAIYLSVCLDVFAAAVAPGVSAPQVLGLWPQHVFPVVRSIAASQKVVSMDIVELSPPFDHDGMTARLAASVLAEFLAASD